MKKKICFLLIILPLFLSAQKNLQQIADEIEAEGKALFMMERASWLGSDLLVAHDDNTINAQIGGYFSCVDREKAIFIFHDQSTPPKALMTITFDQTFDSAQTQFVIEEPARLMTQGERDYAELRANARQFIDGNETFSWYKNTSLNVIPFIYQGDRKIYVLTGPKVSGVVVIGNDYLLTCNDQNEIKKARVLHKNILPIEYGDDENGKQVASMPSHLKSTGPFITPTDICTLMLFAPSAGWKSHYVISKKYISIWNCEENSLLILTQKAWKKIQAHQDGKD